MPERETARRQVEDFQTSAARTAELERQVGVGFLKTAKDLPQRE